MSDDTSRRWWEPHLQKARRDFEAAWRSGHEPDLRTYLPESLGSDRPLLLRELLSIELKYHNGEPVIRELHRVSRPGRRIYAGVKDLPEIYNGLGIAILSTPRGVLSDAEARDAMVGGEVLCTVF